MESFAKEVGNVGRGVLGVRVFGVALLSIAVLLAGAASIDLAYAAEYPTPYRQLSEGVAAEAVQCNEPRDLYIRNSDSPVCITQSTYDTLVGQGVDLEIPTLASLISSIQDAGSEEIQQVVKAAIRMYDIDPEGALDAINSLSDPGIAHYPYVIDPETRTLVADGSDPEQAGKRALIFGEFATNPADEIIDRLQAGDGIWEDYTSLDPETGSDQLKRSWLVLHDGYVFGAGYYYSIDEKMAIGIQNSIDLLKSEGEGAFEIISTASDRGKYATIFDPVTGVELANSRQPHRVGGPAPPVPIPWTDFAKILRATEEPVWAYILIINPVTGEPSQAAGLFDDYDKYLLVNGYAYPAEDKVKRIVDDTIAMYDADKENTFELISKASLDPHYPFVIDPATKKILAHGSNPARVGATSLFFDDITDRPFDEIIAELETDGSAWAQYLYPYPGTDYTEEKLSWLVMHDGYIFGAGYYQSAFIAHPDALIGDSPFPSIFDTADDEYLVYSGDTVLDDPFASSTYKPTRVWADFSVVNLPPLAFEPRNHEFDMVNGNALQGVFIPHLAPFIKQEVAPNLNDPSLLFRYVALLLNGAFDAVAPYHETAVGVSSRMEHRPSSEYETNENPNTAVMHAAYRMMLEFAPQRADDWRDMMTVHGFDPDDESGLDLDCSVTHDVSSPVAIGNFAAKCVLDAHRHDGFNQFGLETDGVPFGDTTGYVSVNTHDMLNDPSRWQPLIAPNLQGELVPQTFVTPQYANIEPFSDFDPRSVRVPPPTSSNHADTETYKAQVDAVIEVTHNITDEQKMLIEFFDNKLRGSLFRPTLSNHQNTVDFVQWDFLVNMANYDAGIVVWQEKALHDAVRPASAIPYVYGDELIKARGPPGGDPVEVPASEWTTYVNTANHPEYPSATASFCATDAVVWRLYSGTDEIDKYVNMDGELVGAYEGVRPAGSAAWEPGQTPVEDVHLGFDSWSEYAEECGASRVWAGVHFWPSVQVLDEIGEVVGTASFKYWESLMLGEAPLRGEFKPLEPDPLLDEPFWTGR